MIENLAACSIIYDGWEMEFAYGVGAERAVNIDTAEGVAGGAGASNGKVGVGAKTTACLYILMQTILSNKACGCESNQLIFLCYLERFSFFGAFLLLQLYC